MSNGTNTHCAGFSTQVDLANSYNSICLENGNLRSQLHESSTLNEKLLDHQKQIERELSESKDIINRYRKQMTTNNMLYLQSLEVFQQQLRKIVSVHKGNEISKSSIDSIQVALDSYCNRVSKAFQTFNPEPAINYDEGSNIDYSDDYFEPSTDDNGTVSW